MSEVTLQCAGCGGSGEPCNAQGGGYHGVLGHEVGNAKRLGLRVVEPSFPVRHEEEVTRGSRGTSHEGVTRDM